MIDRLSVAGRLGQTDIPGDHGCIHLAREVALDLLGDLERKVRAPVEHRQKHALKLQLRVE